MKKLLIAIFAALIVIAPAYAGGWENDDEGGNDNSNINVNYNKPSARATARLNARLSARANANARANASANASARQQQGQEQYQGQNQGQGQIQGNVGIQKGFGTGNATDVSIGGDVYEAAAVPPGLAQGDPQYECAMTGGVGAAGVGFGGSVQWSSESVNCQLGRLYQMGSSDPDTRERALMAFDLLYDRVTKAAQGGEGDTTASSTPDN